jgi:hypothetical protein
LGSIVRVNKSRRLRLVEQAVSMGDIRIANKILIILSEGKRPLGRHKYRWEDDIKMYLKERDSVPV